MQTSRRAALRALGAFGAPASAGAKRARASGAGPRIASVQAYPVVGRFKFFEGPDGRPTGRPSVLVKITAEDGRAGWGQSVPIPGWSYETLETVETTIRRDLAPVLIGRDPLDADAIHAGMNRAIAPSFSTGQPIAKAGVDLAGKIPGETAPGRWGAAGKARIPLSWTLDPRTLDDVGPLVEEGRSRGCRHFNIKVAPDPEFDVALCREVKRLAPGGLLWADAGAAALERPLPANRLGGDRRLVRQGALPIIMDEGVVSSVELEEFIDLGLLDGVAMKPARRGGLTEARRPVWPVRDRGLMLLGSGLADPDLSLAASLRLYGAYDLGPPAALDGPQFLGASPLKRPFRVVDGALEVPDGPGLGVEIDEDRIPELLARTA